MQDSKFDVLKIQKLDGAAVLPTRAHSDDAGLDLYALEDLEIPGGAGVAARTGVALAIARGYVGLIADRSSLGRRGLKTAGGVIDAGYRGEVQILLWNLTQEAMPLKKGERIAQLLLIPIATPTVKEVASLEQTLRGQKGFGSTGK